MKCINCSKELSGQQQKYCSKKCKYKIENKKRKKDTVKKVCPECQRDFIVSFINKKYCSNVCMNKFNKRNYYQNNKDKWEENWKRRTINRRLKQFGITEEEYTEMVVSQDGKCDICGQHPSKKSLCVDHDHKTGKVRGLLCDKCNTGIGNLEDNITYLKNSIKYLKKHK